MKLMWSAVMASVVMLSVPPVHAQQDSLVEPDATVRRLAGNRIGNRTVDIVNSL